MKKALKTLVKVSFIPSLMIIGSMYEEIPKEKRRKGFFGVLWDLWNAPKYLEKRMLEEMKAEQKLTDLKAKGVLSEEEFQAAKQRLLASEQKPQVAPPSINISDELQKLTDLKATGVLSEEEFQAAKQRLLASEQKPQVAPPNINISDELQKLTDLKAKGVLSEEEFQAAKQQLSTSETHNGNAQEGVIVSDAAEKINDTQGEVKHPWYFSTEFIILTILMCFPVGIVFMWLGERFPMWVRVVLTCFFGLIFLILFLG